jgi:hypothetical protein
VDPRPPQFLAGRVKIPAVAGGGGSRSLTRFWTITFGRKLIRILPELNEVNRVDRHNAAKHSPEVPQARCNKSVYVSRALRELNPCHATDLFASTHHMADKHLETSGS